MATGVTTTDGRRQLWSVWAGENSLSYFDSDEIENKDNCLQQGEKKVNITSSQNNGEKKVHITSLQNNGDSTAHSTSSLNDDKINSLVPRFFKKHVLGTCAVCRKRLKKSILESHSKKVHTIPCTNVEVQPAIGAYETGVTLFLASSKPVSPQCAETLSKKLSSSGSNSAPIIDVGRQAENCEQVLPSSVNNHSSTNSKKVVSRRRKTPQNRIQKKSSNKSSQERKRAAKTELTDSTDNSLQAFPLVSSPQMPLFSTEAGMNNGALYHAEKRMKPDFSTNPFYTREYPQPSAICTFGLRQIDHGVYTMSRKFDHVRAVLKSAIPRMLMSAEPSLGLDAKNHSILGNGLCAGNFTSNSVRSSDVRFLSNIPTNDVNELVPTHGSDYPIYESSQSQSHPNDRIVPNSFLSMGDPNLLPNKHDTNWPSTCTSPQNSGVGAISQPQSFTLKLSDDSIDSEPSIPPEADDSGNRHCGGQPTIVHPRSVDVHFQQCNPTVNGILETESQLPSRDGNFQIVEFPASIVFKNGILNNASISLH